MTLKSSAQTYLQDLKQPEGCVAMKAVDGEGPTHFLFDRYSGTYRTTNLTSTVPEWVLSLAIYAWATHKAPPPAEPMAALQCLSTLAKRLPSAGSCLLMSSESKIG